MPPSEGGTYATFEVTFCLLGRKLPTPMVGCHVLNMASSFGALDGVFGHASEADGEGTCPVYLSGCAPGYKTPVA